MFRYDVLCLGAATVDVFLDSTVPLSTVELGDKVLIDSVERHSGGGGTNTAAGLSKLGLNVKVLCKLGDDHDGEFIEKDLRKYNVKNICKNKSRKNTNFSAILSSGGDRIIYAYKGASNDLSMGDFKLSQLNTRWIYLATLMGKSFQTGKKVAEYAHKNNINLFFNPSQYLAAKGKKYLRSILKATTVLVLNKEEAEAVLGRTGSITFLLNGLSKIGPRIVVITNGKKKMYAIADGKVCSLMPPDVKVVHTAGAGDAFNAGLLAGLIKKYSLPEAISLGQACSSSVIQHMGTKNKLLTEKEAQKLIKRYKIRCT
tara:strand:- start:608 stop:1549 length:942 start_codon:yes stop_codon:yes gene_type:complete